MDAGRRIRILRKAKKIDARELAERAGISYGSLMRAEHGRGDLQLKSLARVAEALGVSLGELLDEPTAPVCAEVFAWGGMEVVGEQRYLHLWEPGNELGASYLLERGDFGEPEKVIAEVVERALERRRLPGGVRETPLLRRWGGLLTAPPPPEALFAAGWIRGEVQVWRPDPREALRAWGHPAPPPCAEWRPEPEEEA